ncbi:MULTISPECIES: sugar phosphate isomerase/epimerase family protein [Paenibacillus]|uniref:Sugar phosphate isomerase n=1 Tax=Paenibacillus naphthalenovorans TaxID=162209 RepID=A0A0U2WB84_9BACL|nr:MULTISPECIES: sugar phosphate isomerase/epimerase family protein [Paenibacillus]ALS23630.1 sugar phosphate isomerase [Paenibacillus naphthalenovorans]GCL73468.1 sugar phosphate isomerase/epimerase [Paenibacillus naphthalenovorans]
MKRMGIGLQMYTVRDETAKDFRSTLRKVAELGYEGVEFAGYGDVPAEEMKSLLQELNLKAIGSHVRYHLLQDNLENEIAYLKTIGAEYIVCPNIPQDDRRDWERHFSFFEQVARKAQKHGLQFAYHNHAFEFEEKVGEQFVFDALYDALPPVLAQVEMDLGWVQYIGQDPLAYTAKYSGRLPLLHLKDFRYAEDGGIDTLELGRGIIHLPEVLQAASDADVEWLIVEQDRCQNPPLESVEISMQWLRENYLSRL